MTNIIVLEKTLVDTITRTTGSNPNECYQCGKCTSACPLTSAMDLSPTVIMRLLQVGNIQPVLTCKAIWLCTGCQLCAILCHRQIALPKIIDSLKMLALQYGFGNSSPALLHRTVVHSLASRGRVYSAGVILHPAVSNVSFSRSLSLKWPLLKIGKLKLIPSKIKNKKQLKRIFSMTLYARED